MSTRALRPANVAAAALLIGGVIAAVAPRHAMSVVRIVMVSVAVSFALYALIVHVPPTGWISPFKWMSPFHRGAARDRRSRVGALDLLGSGIRSRRQRIDGAGPLPPTTLRVLQPILATALELDPRDPLSVRSARERVTSETWAVLDAQPMRRPRWYRTLPPDPAQVVATIHRLLDDVGGSIADTRDAMPPGAIPTEKAS